MAIGRNDGYLISNIERFVEGGIGLNVGVEWGGSVVWGGRNDPFHGV